MNPEFHIIGIVGLGLIGGSLAMSIKQKTELTVYGYDLNTDVLESALRCGAVDRVEMDLHSCDVVFIALYPQATVDFVRQHLADGAGSSKANLRPGALVVDLCGIKREISQTAGPMCRAQGVYYIGAHPMAGREVSGFAGARGSLFDGASLVVTPEDETDPAILAALESLMKRFGFGPIVHSSPAYHDRMIAYTSQLAHILSSAYIQNPLALDFSGFTGGSFQDLTRVSRLSSDMWGELFLRNRDMLVEQMDILIDNLERYKQALVTEDAAELWRLMEEGTAIKNALLAHSAKMTSE